MKKALYVDDEREILDLLEAYFESNSDNIEIITCSSPTEGLDILQEEDIKCIISDYSMPGKDMDGFGFFKKIREKYDDIPFILYTGHGSEELASEAFSLGLSSYIKKGGPEKMGDLLETVKEQINSYETKKFSRKARATPLDIIDKIREGVLVLDHDYKIVYCNSQAEKIIQQGVQGNTNKKINECEGENLLDIIPGITNNIVYDMINKAIEGEKSEEVYYYEPWDKWFSTEALPIKDRVYLMFDEVTSTKEKENIHKQVIENITDVITIIDEEGTIKYQTPSISYLGYKQNELIGKNVFTLVHEEDQESVVNEFRELIDNNTEIGSVRYRFKTKNDGYEWCRSTSGKNSFIPGLGYVINTRIVSEQVQRERELEAKNKRLEEFTDIISHDTPNHLHIIKGYANMIEDNEEKVEKIINSANRLEELLDSMKKVVEQKEINKETVNIRNIANNISIKDEKANIKIQNDFQIKADREKLKQLVENLVWNSITHNEEKVNITIGSNQNYFFVEDDGKGIPEEKREEVFKIGNTTKKGKGMGLAIVNKTAIEHNWRIELVESKKGGARFEFHEAEIKN